MLKCFHLPSLPIISYLAENWRVETTIIFEILVTGPTGDAEITCINYSNPASDLDTYTTIQKFGVTNIYFLYLKNTFNQQGHIKLIRSDSKDIYNVTMDFYFK